MPDIQGPIGGFDTIAYLDCGHCSCVDRYNHRTLSVRGRVDAAERFRRHLPVV